MLESELNDREFNDHATGGRAPGELTPSESGPAGGSSPLDAAKPLDGSKPLDAAKQSVPAAVFQPPQVVFQPPAARPDVAWPEPAPAAPHGAPGTAGDAGDAGPDDDEGPGRRRRRRPSRSRARNGDQDGPAEDGDDAEPDKPAADQGHGAAAPEGGKPASRSRSRRSGAARDGAAKDTADAGPAESGSPGDSGQTEPNGSAQAQDTGADDAEDDGESGGGNGRRRRRKRRRGSSDGTAGSDSGSGDDPPDTVVHIREPNANDDVRSVKGSTRLEAKKQRRREGRETGRRRPPVITESEFLARRESVERTMVVRQRKDRTQIAVLEDGVLVEHYVNRSSHQSYVGNVYLGKVQNVLPSMEAAFVDVGKGRNAVLYAGEVNFDVSGLEGQSKRIESALKSGQSLIAQVTKDPVGHKGARLTSQVSLPGRYLVYVPGASMTGISRKLPDTERTRLKQILKKVMPEHAGVIVRTAAEGAAEEELSRDVSRLAAQWEAIEKKSKTASAPALLYSEPDLTIRVIRDVFNEDFAKLIVSGDEAWDVVDEYVKYVAPHLADRLTRWEGDRDAFADYRVDEQLAKALERKVWLPSGGSLVIDKTEAMTVIDVNTGKFTGQGGNLEETVTRNNLEAAEEIVRQLRLRDIGGIVVIDFIDMVLESNRELVLRRLLECLARDRTKHQVAEVTSLGLVQMTRKRVGAGLLEAFSTPCECCNGRGVIVSLDLDSAPAPHHAHSGGRGNGNGNAGSGRGGGNGARTPAAPTPAAVAARAHQADVAAVTVHDPGQSGNGTAALAAAALPPEAGPRHDGPQHDGADHDGPRHDGPRHDGPRHDGADHDGSGPDGAVSAGAVPAGAVPAGAVPVGSGPDGAGPDGGGPAEPARSGSSRRRRRRPASASAPPADAAGPDAGAVTGTAVPPPPAPEVHDGAA